MSHIFRNIAFAAAIIMAGLAPAGMAIAQRQMPTPQQRVERLKDSLKLSDEQSAAIVRIYQDADQSRKALFDSANAGDRDARMAAMRGLSEKTDARIDSLLTPDQKVKYGEMKKQRQQGFGGRRRGRE